MNFVVVILWFLYYLPGILYKGNGENQFISQQPPVVSSIMGNGRRRSISCPSCNGQADGNKLLAPVALACGIDGSLYIGDFNYVRRIFPSGNVTSVLELRYVLLTFGPFELWITDANWGVEWISDVVQLRASRCFWSKKVDSKILTCWK